MPHKVTANGTTIDTRAHTISGRYIRAAYPRRDHPNSRYTPRRENS